jgi:hypothetical protein
MLLSSVLVKRQEVGLLVEKFHMLEKSAQLPGQAAVLSSLETESSRLLDSLKMPMTSFISVPKLND